MKIGIVFLFVLTLAAGPASGMPADKNPNVNGSIEYKINETNITASVNIDARNANRKIPLHIGEATITDTSNRCLEESDRGYADYHVDQYCDEVEFEIRMNANKSVRNGTGFITDSNRSEIGFVYRNQQEIRIQDSKDEFHWSSLSDVLDSKNREGILLSDDYILGGAAWEVDNVTVGEDTVSLYHIENGENDVSSLKKYKVSTDGESELINMFIITGEGNDTFGSYGGAYFPWTNSIVIREKMGFGATIHEYAHSQQSYDTSDNMKWMSEGGATYDSTFAAEVITNRSEERINKRKSVYRPKVRNSTLSNSSTWSGLTVYSKGQSIFFLLDTCIKGRTDGDRDSRYLVKHLRTQTDNITIDTLSYSVYHIISSTTETESGELGDIKEWMKPYIHTDKNADKEVLVGDSYTQCWWKSSNAGSENGNTDMENTEGSSDVVEQIRNLVELF